MHPHLRATHVSTARIQILSSAPLLHQPTGPVTRRALLSTSPARHKRTDALPPRPTLPDHEIKHVYLKGSGPGGQKINKTSSAVQLTHLPTGLVVKSQATRSRSQNHTIARRILAEKIELRDRGPESRVAKKVERARRRKASAGKKTRRKYRKLEEGKAGDEGPVAVVAASAAAVAVGGDGLGYTETGYGEDDEEWEYDDNEFDGDETGFESEDAVDDTHSHSPDQDFSGPEAEHTAVPTVKQPPES